MLVIAELPSDAALAFAPKPTHKRCISRRLVNDVRLSAEAVALLADRATFADERSKYGCSLARWKKTGGTRHGFYKTALPQAIAAGYLKRDKRRRGGPDGRWCTAKDTLRVDSSEGHVRVFRTLAEMRVGKSAEGAYYYIRAKGGRRGAYARELQQVGFPHQRRRPDVRRGASLPHL